MEFNKRYNRSEFVDFLYKFLPKEGFVSETTEIEPRRKTEYIQSVTRLGTCDVLNLAVYEMRHKAKYARVGLSKDAFRFLASESLERALVVFVPENSDDNYRFSLITIDIEETEKGKTQRVYSNPRRFSYYLGEGIAYYTPQKYLTGRVTDEKDLTERFSVEVLAKEFYQELSDWYAWAVKVIRFPNKLDDKNDDDMYNAEAAIRLVTRLIFVWFLKQKHLIPEEFFDEDYIKKNLLNEFYPQDLPPTFDYSQGKTTYYKAVLQNLFFAMLNCPITPEGSSEISERRFVTEGGNDNRLMHYESLFINPKHFIDLANQTVPFLNGGLFDCLDDNDFYSDGFSDKKEVQKSLYVPDFLFFVDEAVVDLSVWYGDKKKKKTKVTGLLNILKRYNFTVEENMPFDQEVSLDPELLGKVFENLLASYNPETQTTARKQTGSFYTPRDIVQYMVDESIVAHLKRTVGEELEAEYRKLISYVDVELHLTGRQKVQIMESIFHCKVLDPACGSGAFPMGMLQQMVHILSQLDPTNDEWKRILLEDAGYGKTVFLAEIPNLDSNFEYEERRQDIENSFDERKNNPDYARKLYLIERCIYGVDIQPIAIQISKLRIFISLVIDQKANTDPVKNFGIRPLPNLEAKFVAANSLIPLGKTENSLARTDEIIEIEEDLKEANHNIFSAKTNRTKRRWKERLLSLRAELGNKLRENGFFTAEATNQIESWNTFDQNTAASFFDADWMFGIKDGFDVVIGNPPYIQLQANNGKLANLYKSYDYKTFVRTGNIYSLFYERGWQTLKANGCLCYITSNQWMRAGYGEKTREFLAEHTNPVILIDFSGIDIFESATVVTNILLFTRTKNYGQTICVATNNNHKTCLSNLHSYVCNNKYMQNLSTSEGWVILTPQELSIKQKIINAGIPLKDWNIKICRGVLTGYNDAFIINTKERNTILANCQTENERERTAELIRPILRGRDIKRFGYNWANLWLINTHNGIRGKYPRVSIKDYPAIKLHLDKYWEKLSTRSDKGDTPYNLRNCAYMEDFLNPKIIYPETTKGARFAYDETGIFIDKTCFMLISDNALYLQRTLSSKLFEVAYNKMFSSVELVNHTYQYNKHALIKLPIINDANAIKQLSVIDNEENIDMFIYHLYNLTYDEILVIDPNTQITREEYEK